jgi:hypothetical protein
VLWRFRISGRLNPAPIAPVPDPMTPILAATLLVLTALFSHSPQPEQEPEGVPSRTSQGLPDHSLFSAVLARVVDVPHVDYVTLRQAPGELDRYLEALGATSLQLLEAAPREAQLAFWINAYNACMLRRVISHYPLENANPGLRWRLQNRVAGRPANSVWQIRDVFTGDFCMVAGEERSLDEIEHAIIRPMGEPRIHFAVNCAARSCPPLVPQAYTAEELDRQLDARVRAFVATPAQFAPDPEAGVVRLNAILNWFGEDFGGHDGVKSFFVPYLSGSAREMMEDPSVKLSFMDYDWTLNERP